MPICPWFAPEYDPKTIISDAHKAREVYRSPNVILARIIPKWLAKTFDVAATIEAAHAEVIEREAKKKERSPGQRRPWEVSPDSVLKI